MKSMEQRKKKHLIMLHCVLPGHPVTSRIALIRDAQILNGCGFEKQVLTLFLCFFSFFLLEMIL